MSRSAPHSPGSTEAARAQRRRAAITLGWTLAWLLLLDLGLGALTRPPRDVRREPSALQRYFDYGRSVEGKLRMRVGEAPDSSAPIVSAGWLKDEPKSPQPAQASDDAHVLVAAYGQSFTHQVTRLLTELDPRFEHRLLGGPAAPLSHSYALFERDRGKHRAQIAVLGIVASTLPMLATMTPMTAMPEDPYPYTYPRYTLRDGALHAVEPLVQSFAELRAALHSPARFERWVAQLRAHDAAFQPAVFRADPFDASVLGRAMRRAYAQRVARGHVARYRGGHDDRDGLLAVARALLVQFSQRARADGQTPYVLLFQDRGTGNSLEQALGEVLRAHQIPYLSSFATIPPDAASSFERKGTHFRPAMRAALARVWLEDLRTRGLGAQPRRAQAGSSRTRPRAPALTRVQARHAGAVL